MTTTLINNNSSSTNNEALAKIRFRSIVQMTEEEALSQFQHLSSRAPAAPIAPDFVEAGRASVPDPFAVRHSMILGDQKATHAHHTSGLGMFSNNQPGSTQKIPPEQPPQRIPPALQAMLPHAPILSNGNPHNATSPNRRTVPSQPNTHNNNILPQNPFNQIVAISDNDDSIVRQFMKPVDPLKLQHEYTVVWYEKLALETTLDRTLAELSKRDEIIHQLRMELTQERNKQRIH